MKVGDNITVKFPTEPDVRCAGTTTTATVAQVREGDYPLRVEWQHEGTTLSRYIRADWVAGESKPRKEPAKKRRAL